MSAAWTPGPWEAADRVVVVTQATHGYSTWIANAAVGGASGEEQSANARLIAASPDLYAALEAMLDHYVSTVNSGDCGNWDPETEDVVKAARAALARGPRDDFD